MLKELPLDLIQQRLTSLFLGELTEGIARERDVARHHRRIDVTVLVWTFILGFAVGGGSHTIAGPQHAYATVTNQTFSHSSFYDRFALAFRQLFSDLLESTLEEVAVSHTLALQLQQLRGMMTADATVFRLHRLLSKFLVTRSDQSGMKLHLVHNLTKQATERFGLTDERNHESSQFRMGNWLRGRLSPFDLGFYSCRRFALIEESGGFFLSRLKTNANPRITEARRKWCGCAISLSGRRLQDVLSGLTREIIDVTAEVSFKRCPYGERHLSAMMESRIVGVHNENTGDYHLYVTDLSDELTPKQVAVLYGIRWEVEVLFRELKSIYGLEKFQISNPVTVELLVIAALLMLTVSRALLDAFQRMHPETMFPREHWAETFRFFAQFVFEDLAQSFGHPLPNLVELMLCNVCQPEKSCLLFSERVAGAFRTEVRA